MKIADGLLGRIDASQLYDTWADIKDRKFPLKAFHQRQILPVRVLGLHDSRNHKFLPISHRQGKTPVFELTARKSAVDSNTHTILTIDKVEVGSFHLVFVNNVQGDVIWVNLSPNVRGRLRSMDASDDVSLLKDLPKNFPPGCALRAKVIHVDITTGHIDLTARSDGSTKEIKLQELSPGMILPGRVTKVTDRLVMVQLNESLSGALHIIDMADDYSTVNTLTYQKNQTLRVFVKEVDRPNKRVVFSTRPSKILSSSLPVRDTDVTSISQLRVGQVIRGYIKNVADLGLFISLSTGITAFVRIADLSDEYLKDWKSQYEVDNLVEGKILSVEESSSRITMTLKSSELDSDFKPLLTFDDVRQGQILSGKIRRVEDFGVFVVVDHSSNVSGLCHRTQMSDRRNANPKTLFEVGNKVKAKVLAIDEGKRQISFGLKASYFDEAAGDQDDEDVVMASDDGGVTVDPDAKVDANDNDSDSDGNSDGADADIIVDSEEAPPPPSDLSGLGAGGFDWSGGLDRGDEPFTDGESDADASYSKQNKHRAPHIQVDLTANLDKDGAQNASDFERQLLSKGNSSLLWLQFMAFQLQFSDVAKVRELAERALGSIDIQHQDERFDVWIGYLEIELAHGNPESFDTIFQRACSHNDPQSVHEAVASTYIKSGQYDQADELFQKTIRKFRASSALYLNYAGFLFGTLRAPDRARTLLPRALQTLPAHEHRDITKRFAMMEFEYASISDNSSTEDCGDPERGRTMFETLLTQWPKRTDLWRVRVDMEESLILRLRETKKTQVVPSSKTSEKSKRDEEQILETVRALFERLTKQNIATGDDKGQGKLKPYAAKKLFERWLSFEQKCGGTKSVEKVKARAADYVKTHKGENT